MTRYTQEEAGSRWEFKIVRSDSGDFRKPEELAALLEQEALAGWEMVEKFDDQRIRFKRLRETRKRDDLLPPGVDPYRTQYGGTSRRAAVILGVIMAVLLALSFLGLVLFLSLYGG